MTVQWTKPATESSSLVTTELDSLADGSESASFTLDNSSTKALYAKIRLAPGSTIENQLLDTYVRLYPEVTGD